MHQVKVASIGNSLGSVLRKEIVGRLSVAGDEHLSLSQTGDGIELSPFDSALEEQMRLAEEIMDRYRDTLREFAS